MPKNPIPSSGWRTLRLSDIATERKERANDSKAEVFSITKHDGAIPSLEYFDRKVFSRDTSNYKLMLGGDLAYATIHLDEGSLGIMAKGQQGIVSPMYTVFYVDESQVLPEFLYKLMKLPQNIHRYQRLGEGSIHRRKSIRFNVLSSLILSIPSIDIQKSILEILDSIEKTIERTEDVTAETEQLRDSLLNKLLTRGLPGHHTRMEEVSGIDTVPANWQVARIDEIADIIGGSTPSRNVEEYWGGDIPWVIPSELTNLQSRYLSSTNETITKEGLNSGGIKMIPSKSVLLTTRATIGKAAINLIPVTTNQGFQNLIPKYGTDPVWLYYYISHIHQELNRRATGSTFREVSRKDIRSLSVLYPPLTEQKKIANILESIDDVIERKENVKFQTEQLQDALVHELLIRGHPG